MTKVQDPLARPAPTGTIFRTLVKSRNSIVHPATQHGRRTKRHGSFITSLEVFAAFLAGEAGIQNDMLIENSAAYLQSWIKVLKAEPRMAVIAAAQAQRSCDHILGKSFEDSDN